MLSQKLWFNANTVLQDFIIVLSSIMEYAENLKKKQNVCTKACMILNTGQSLLAGTVLELDLIAYMLTLTLAIYPLTSACILHRPSSF